MKRIIALTTASLMASAAFAGPALANDLDIGSDTDANTQVEMNSDAADVDVGADVDADMQADSGSTSGTMDSDVDSGTTASTDGQADLNTAMSALSDGTAASTIKGMSEVSTVNVVEIGSTSESDSSADIDATMDDDQGKIADLRTAIESNDAVKSKLDAQQVDVSDVVAAQAQADGSLTVYVR